MEDYYYTTHKKSPRIQQHPARAFIAAIKNKNSKIINIISYKTHKKPLRIQQHPASASTATLKNSTWTGQGHASCTA
jgi:hypothetical protein